MGTIPINPDLQIRLISILPDSNNVADLGASKQLAIPCKVPAHLLDEPPPYIALSYAWGDSSDPLPITVNKGVVKVSRNLHSALVHLRHDFGKRFYG